MVLQFSCSTFSKKSYVTKEVKVLYKPALIPFGGSLVILIEF
jgi:hypothetical protein